MPEVVVNAEKSNSAKVIITNTGLNKIASATVVKPLVLKNFKIGAGNTSSHGATTTQLSSAKYEAPINYKYSKLNLATIECVVPINANIAEGFTVTELGIFDDQNSLIIVVILPPNYRPPKGSEITTETVYTITLKVSNVNNITVAVEHGVFATVESLNKEVSDRMEENRLFMRTILKGFIGTMFAGPKDAKIGIFDKDLVEKMYCEGQTLRTSEYPELASILGQPNSFSSFKLPDTRDRVLRNLGPNNPNTSITQEDAVKKASFKLENKFLANSSTAVNGIGTFASLVKATKNEGDVEIDVTTGLIRALALGSSSKLEDTATNITLGTATETRVKSYNVRYWMITKVLI